MKKNVETISSALDKVLKLRGVTFEWKTEEYEEMNFSSGKHLGFIAQEVETVVPEVVNQNNEGYKSIEYANLVAVLIEAVKEIKTEQDALQESVKSVAKGDNFSSSHSQIEDLRSTIQTQQAEIEALKAELKSLKELLAQQ